MTNKEEINNPYIDEKVLAFAYDSRSKYTNPEKLMFDVVKRLFEKNPYLKYSPADLLCAKVLNATRDEVQLYNAAVSTGKWKIPHKLTVEVVAFILCKTENMKLLKTEGTPTPTLVAYNKTEGIWELVLSEYSPAFCEQAFAYDGNMSDASRRLLKTRLESMLYKEGQFISLTLNPRYEAVENGIWDFTQQKLIDFDTAKESNLVFTNKISTPYNPNAQIVYFYDEVNDKWITIDSLIFELLQGDKDKIEALWLAMHSMIRPHCSGFQKSIWIVDSAKTGGNGKSVIGDLITGIIGKVDTTSLSGLNESSAGGFSLSTLPSVLAIISTDAETDEYVNDSEIFKKLTTHDSIRINIKNKDLIPNYHWYGQTWFTFNGFPCFRDKSEAIDRRAYIIDFNVRFTSNKNEKIKTEFIRRTVLHEYVLKRLLEMDIRKYKEFDFQKKLISDFRNNSQPVDQFLNYICDPKNRGDEISHWDMYPYSWLWDAFRDWYAEENNNRPTKYGRNSFIEEVRRWSTRNQFGWEATMSSSKAFTVSSAMACHPEIFSLDLQGVTSQSSNLRKWIYEPYSCGRANRQRATYYFNLNRSKQIRGIRRIPTKSEN